MEQSCSDQFIIHATVSHKKIIFAITVVRSLWVIFDFRYVLWKRLPSSKQVIIHSFCRHRLEQCVHT